jgi:hypothetical protein
MVAKWTQFERSFKSKFAYPNALQDATLTVVFTSPLGTTNHVYAFWDGDRTWRVRFAPDQPGKWTFATICSDTANSGLNHQSGEFLCTAATGENRFRRHGPIVVARDHRQLEHADGTPLFWLADVAWNGARVSDQRDWEFYSEARAFQKFTVIQWSAAPGLDDKKQTAFQGTNRFSVNPEYCKRLDTKVETLSRAGLLNAIAPLAEIEASGKLDELPDDQAFLLLRYMVARWGAAPVAWLIALDGDSEGKQAARWKRIGSALFSNYRHAPVVLYPGENHWLLDEFRSQGWVDVFEFQAVQDVTPDALKWCFSGPPSAEWKKEPARPLIIMLPCENGLAGQSTRRFSAEDTRRAAYWSLLVTPAAGVSYKAMGVANWNTTLPETAKLRGKELPVWKKSLFMPAAKELSVLADFLPTLDYRRLRPRPKLLAAQPGKESPKRFVAAASTEKGDLTLAYVPEDRVVELQPGILQAASVATWINPRTGKPSPATGVASGRGCRFVTPEPGDWLLMVKAGK